MNLKNQAVRGIEKEPKALLPLLAPMGINLIPLHSKGFDPFLPYQRILEECSYFLILRRENSRVKPFRLFKKPRMAFRMETQMWDVLDTKNKPAIEGCRHCCGGDSCHYRSCFDILEEILHTRNEQFSVWSVHVQAEKREHWTDDKFRERSSRRRQRHRPVNLLYMAVWAPIQQGGSLKWAVQDLALCGLWVCTMTLGLGVEMNGVLFVFRITSYIPIHLEECEGQILQFKMPYTITRKKWHSFRWVPFLSLCLLTLWLPHLPPSPSRGSVQHCYCQVKQPQPHCQLPLPHFVNLCSGFTFWYFRPINVHIPMFCLYFNLGVCVPPWADHDARGNITKLRDVHPSTEIGSHLSMGFPYSLDGKESVCNAGNPGSITR